MGDFLVLKLKPMLKLDSQALHIHFRLFYVFSTRRKGKFFLLRDYQSKTHFVSFSKSFSCQCAVVIHLFLRAQHLPLLSMNTVRPAEFPVGSHRRIRILQQYRPVTQAGPSSVLTYLSPSTLDQAREPLSNVTHLIFLFLLLM